MGIALPFFYIETIDTNTTEIVLNEETSKHIVQVLRMQPGEHIQLTDGKGKRITAEIADSNRKKCAVTILKSTNHKPPTTNIAIAISLLKNVKRFEWFLEKATEIGVQEIIPLICARTEKQQFRYERMKTILVSALLQSQQCRLPVLHEPVIYDTLWQSSHVLPKLDTYHQKFIAHCMEDTKRDLADLINKNLAAKMILIGPEGDFTAEEILLAIKHHYIPVSLGNTRLRTETAGVVAASLLCLA